MRPLLNSLGKNMPLPEKRQWKKNLPGFIFRTSHRRFLFFQYKNWGYPRDEEPWNEQQKLVSMLYIMQFSSPRCVVPRVLKVRTVQKSAGQIQGKYGSPSYYVQPYHAWLSTSLSATPLGARKALQEATACLHTTSQIPTTGHYWVTGLNRALVGLNGHWCSEYRGTLQSQSSVNLKLALTYAFSSCPHFAAKQTQESFCQVVFSDYL